MSGSPNASTQAVTAARTSVPFETSHCCAFAFAPSAVATVCAFAPSRSTISTRAPSATNSLAMPSPKPPAAPVTIATFPSSCPMIDRLRALRPQHLRFDRDDRVDLPGKIRQVGEQRLAFGARECCDEIVFGIEPELGEAVVAELGKAVAIDEVDRIAAQLRQLLAEHRVRVHPMVDELLVRHAVLLAQDAEPLRVSLCHEILLNVLDTCGIATSSPWWIRRTSSDTWGRSPPGSWRAARARGCSWSRRAPASPSDTCRQDRRPSTSSNTENWPRVAVRMMAAACRRARPSPWRLPATATIAWRRHRTRAADSWQSHRTPLRRLRAASR